MARLKGFGTIVCAAMLVAAGGSAGAEYPDKELRIIVNYGAGGGVDRTARSIQRFLPDAFGQNVIVENYPGAGGKVGLQKFLEAPRDGYTVLTAFAPATTLVQYMNPDMFNASEDLAYINMQWADPAILIAHKDTGWRNLQDMIAAVRENPGEYTFATSGKGSVGPLLANVLFDRLDLDIPIVPYKGGGAARGALQGGHVDMTAAGSSGALSVKDDSVVLGAFWSGDVPGWPEAEPVNAQLPDGVEGIPEGAAYRFFAVHKEVKEKYPERWRHLVEAFRKTTTENGEFLEFTKRTSVGSTWLGPEESASLLSDVNGRFMEIIANQFE